VCIFKIKTTNNNTNEQCIVQAQVPIHVLREIRFFNDLLECCNLDDNDEIWLPFPDQYNDVAVPYINFINGKYVNEFGNNIFTNIQDGNLLCQTLELCHYLDDNQFLKFLVNGMQHGIHFGVTKPDCTPDCNYNSKCSTVRSWSWYLDMISTLPDNIQWDIHLLSPFTFAPAHYQNNQAFIDMWVKSNITSNVINNITNNVKIDSVIVSHIIDNEYIYNTIIKFHDDSQLNIKELSCERSWIDNPTLFETHVLYREWFALSTTCDGTKVKHIKVDRIFVHDKDHGYYGLWYVTCNLS